MAAGFIPSALPRGGGELHCLQGARLPVGMDGGSLLPVIRHVVGEGVSEEAVLALAAAARVRAVGRGEHLVHVGDELDEVVFVLEGVARSYVVDASGREITDCLVSEGEVLMPSADLRGPSPCAMDALTGLLVLCIDTACVEQLVSTDITIGWFYIETLRWAWFRQWEIKRAMRQCDAAGRYAWFVERYGQLVGRIPDYHIASFLGMNPVTLSRARSKVLRAAEARGL